MQVMWAGIQDLMLGWYKAKIFLEHAVAFSSDSVHVIVGVLILFFTAAAMKRSVSAWSPWLIVLALAVLNEIVDLYVEQWPDMAQQYGESAKDLLLTMFLPTFLMLWARRKSRL